MEVLSLSRSGGEVGGCHDGARGALEATPSRHPGRRGGARGMRMMWRWGGECIHMLTMPSGVPYEPGAPGDVLADERALQIAADALVEGLVGRSRARSTRASACPRNAREPHRAARCSPAKAAQPMLVADVVQEHQDLALGAAAVGRPARPPGRPPGRTPARPAGTASSEGSSAYHLHRDPRQRAAIRAFQPIASSISRMPDG